MVKDSPNTITDADPKGNVAVELSTDSQKQVVEGVVEDFALDSSAALHCGDSKVKKIFKDALELHETDMGKLTRYIKDRVS